MTYERFPEHRHILGYFHFGSCHPECIGVLPLVISMCQPVQKPLKAPHVARNVVSSLLSNRSTLFDIICFLVPALFCSVTNVVPIYLTGFLGMLSTHLTLTAHYMFVDKDNYFSKLSQKQIQREKSEYLVGIVLHMWAQLVLQLLFPGKHLLPDLEHFPICLV